MVSIEASNCNRKILWLHYGNIWFDMKTFRLNYVGVFNSKLKRIEVDVHLFFWWIFLFFSTFQPGVGCPSFFGGHRTSDIRPKKIGHLDIRPRTSDIRFPHVQKGLSRIGTKIWVQKRGIMYYLQLFWYSIYLVQWIRLKPFLYIQFNTDFW